MGVFKLEPKPAPEPWHEREPDSPEEAEGWLEQMKGRYDRTLYGRFKNRQAENVARKLCKIAGEHYKEKAEAKLAELTAADEAEFEASKSWIPPVSTTKYEAGVFLEFEEHSVYLAAIIDIRGADRIRWSGLYDRPPNRAPRMYSYSPMSLGGAYDPDCWYVEDRPQDLIEIELNTGTVHQIWINFHKAPILLKALRDAWRGDAA